MADDLRPRAEWSIFTEPGYVTVSDPYVDVKEQKIHEIKGVRNFQTAPLRQGQMGGDWGEKTRKYVPAWTGEPYVDPLLARKRAKKLATGNKDYLTPEGFRYSNPAKRATGPGDTYGSFTKRHLGLPPRGRAESARPRRREEGDGEPKNFVASSTKRQGVGPNCRPVSGGAFPVLTGPYEPQVLSFRKDDAAHRKLMAEKRPFSSAAAPRYTFDVREHAPVPASRVYSADERCLRAPKGPEDGLTRKQQTEERLKARPEKPFRPTHPPRRGYNGTLSKFPEHVPDEYDTWKIDQAMKSRRLLPDHRRKKGLAESMASRPTWKTNSVTKSKLTRSIATGNFRAATISRIRR